MPLEFSEVQFTTASFGGCDIHPTIGGVPFGSLKAVSFTIQREKAPNFTMGMVDCRSYSRGKRGIAGSLVFQVFDRSELLEALRIANKAKFTTPKKAVRFHDLRQGKNRDAAGGDPLVEVGLDASGFSEFTRTDAWYVDQIPPFTITLNAVNEGGSAMTMAIHGVDILNHGSGSSIDDMQLDESMTYVCTTITPWRGKKLHV